MGIIEKMIRLTPFYKKYKAFKQKKITEAQERLELSQLPHRINFYKQFINDSDLVFDIGANVGNRIAAFIGCKAEIVAVEPQPACVMILKEKFANQITIEQVGLSDTPGELQMHLSTDSTVSSFNSDFINKTKNRFKHSQWNETITVPVITLDTLIKKYGIPKFCKIDVEGFELRVLKGLSSGIPFLSFEYCVPEMQADMLLCIEQLNKISPAGKFNYSIAETMELALNDWMPFHEFLALAKSTAFTNTLFGDVYFKS